MHSTLEFAYLKINQRETVSIGIELPLKQNAREIAMREISTQKLPLYVEDKLTETIETFSREESYRLSKIAGGQLIDRAVIDDAFRDEMVNQWVQAFKSETAEFAIKEEVKAEDFVAEIYHQLIHSPAYRELLMHEQNFADDYGVLVVERDAEFEALMDMNSEELARALGSHSDAMVCALTNEQERTRELFESEWKTKLDSLRREQKHQFHQWLLAMAEVLQIGSMSGIAAQNREFLERNLESDGGAEHFPKFQESFTVHLGTQMKQSHNLKLVASDAMNLCRPLWLCGSSICPQRLHMAMSLYSNNLSGLILLADNSISTHSGKLRDLAAICGRLPELHFEPFEEQLEEALRLSLDGSEWRELKALAGEPISADSNGYCPSGGDFYVTKHSNLAEMHVIFHLVCDDSVTGGDINSRHPTILGIRNILKWSCLNDVRNLAIPLFLVHELKESMTPSWCIKRAELVFKCVKGFMMEMTGWGVSHAQTLQFVIPSSVDFDLFQTLSSMLTTIFRVANPLVFSQKV